MTRADDQNTPLDPDDPVLLAALRDVDGLLADLSDEAPPETLVKATLDAVAAEPARPEPAPRSRRMPIWTVAALIALGGVAVASSLMFGGRVTGLFETADGQLDNVDSNLGGPVAAAPAAPADVSVTPEQLREQIQRQMNRDQVATNIPTSHSSESREVEVKRSDLQILTPGEGGRDRMASADPMSLTPPPPPAPEATPSTTPEADDGPARDAYRAYTENPFLRVQDQPKSTFSVDVDTASYSNVRRFLNEGRLPPGAAVRVEELLNYFPYDYEAPLQAGDRPFSVTTEVGPAPWRPEHRLVHIGLQAPEVMEGEMPPRNLVFLLDVSGSMNNPDKLPLLKTAMSLLVETLTDNDRVAIVVYAGAAGVVLEPTSGHEQAAILAAIERLRSGGSTAGGAGIRLAYELARRNFVEGGINRVILGTDGDFNVGTSSEGELRELVEKERKSGVFLTVLGFGRGNLADDRMETLADHGNGNYAYIDSVAEAKKVLVREAGGTLITVAKDVKIQVEFNPAEVAGYRLIGYENRVLANRDFADDTKDAGDIGGGHSVTALYEVVPAGVRVPNVDDEELKYQTPNRLTEAARSGELMTVRLRWKQPTGSKSDLSETPVIDRGKDLGRTSDDFRWSAAVAAWGMGLEGSTHLGGWSLSATQEIAAGAVGDDPGGYRAEALRLMEKTRALSR